jgi:hypothetical protein
MDVIVCFGLVQITIILPCRLLLDIYHDYFTEGRTYGIALVYEFLFHRDTHTVYSSNMHFSELNLGKLHPHTIVTRFQNF